MRIRKALGLMLTFTMAHVAMVGGDLACDRHEVAPAPASDMATMHHGAAGADHDTVPQQAPCDAPSSTRCCEALTSCAVAVTLPSSMALGAAPVMASVVVPSIDDIPASRVVAPDPPPPKA